MGDAGGSSSAQTTGEPAASDTSSETSSPASETGASETADTTAGGSYCGDGVVDAALLEECDDGNLDETDHCANTCRKIRLVFLTSADVQGNINGLQNADATCKSLAYKAMMADPGSRITNASNFKALLPISTQTVFERHYHGAGPYQLVNGLRVSDSFDQLFSEPHENAINVDERSMTRHVAVWTGMAADGQNFPGVDYCKDWTSISGTSNFGDADSLDGWWLHVDIAKGNPTKNCGGNLAIYCLEQE